MKALDQALEILSNSRFELLGEVHAAMHSALAEVLEEGVLGTLQEQEVAQYLDGAEEGLRTQLVVSRVLDWETEELHAEGTEGK
ncbi:MAG: hypothetical protein AAB853_01610 [Patescibacteria group bacterium]